MRGFLILLVLCVPCAAADDEIKITMPPKQKNAHVWEMVGKGQMDAQVLAPAGKDEEALLKAAVRGCKTHRSAHYLLISDLGETGLRSLGKKADRLYEALAKSFGATVDEKRLLRLMNMRRKVLEQPLHRNETMKIAYFRSSSRFTSFSKKYFKGETPGGIGFADPETNTCVLRRMTASKLGPDAVLSHELTHLFVDSAFARAIQGQIPEWLAEGAATYFETVKATEEGTTGVGDINTYRLGLLSSSSLYVEKILKTSSGVHATGRRAAATQAKCWALYHYLKHGPEDYRKRFAAYEKAVYAAYFKTPEDGIKHGRRMFSEAFGGRLSQLGRDLRSYIKKLKRGR